VEMDFVPSNGQVITSCDGGSGVTPEVSPMFLSGTISSTRLTLYSSQTQVGTFNFTTDIMTGTFDYTWSAVYNQEEYTDTNAIVLTRK